MTHRLVRTSTILVSLASMLTAFAGTSLAIDRDIPVFPTYNSLNGVAGCGGFDFAQESDASPDPSPFAIRSITYSGVHLENTSSASIPEHCPDSSLRATVQISIADVATGSPVQPPTVVAIEDIADPRAVSVSASHFVPFAETTSKFEATIKSELLLGSLRLCQEDRYLLTPLGVQYEGFGSC